MIRNGTPLGTILVCALAALTVPTAFAAPTRVLFIGNSFTFVNDLPHQLVNIASSLGQQVEVANSTHGGCTAYAQRAEADNRTAELLQQEWDFIVLQSYSNLPTIKEAREKYLAPALESFVAKKKSANIVMYLTWGYHDGTTTPCPTSGPAACFPLGTNANLTEPPCETAPDYEKKMHDFPCMGYALARGYMDTKAKGADLIAPCGLAWQVARGASPPDAGCRAAIDAEYAAPSPFSAANNLTFPLAVGGLPASLQSFELYRTLKGGFDKHPNVAGQYLNALVFYSVLFGASPVGAAQPLKTGHEGLVPLSAEILLGLQHTAASVVLDHKTHWGM